MFIHQQLTSQQLRQMRHLIALVEGSVVLGLKNGLCQEEALPLLHKYKVKLNRLLSASDMALDRYISHEQMAVLRQIIDIGMQLIPKLLEKQLIGAEYQNEFITIVDSLHNVISQ